MSTPAIRTGSSNGSVSEKDRLALQQAPRGPDGQRQRRRIFTAEYKLSILVEYDRCTVPGDKGALLRREGLYSSLITDWRRQHREGSLVATPGRSEGGRGGPSRTELDRLRRENEQLRKKLAKAEAVIEVQGKVQALLEEISKSAEPETE